MKTLILFASRHGFTRRCATLLKESLDDGVDLFELGGQAYLPNLTAYDQIVLGGPVYAGRPHPALVKFARKHQDSLLSRQLYLFVTSLSGRATAQQYLTATYPAAVVDHALKRSAFGGAIDQSQLAFWERWTLAVTKGIKGDVSNLDIHEIAALAAEIAKNREKPSV